MQCKRGTCEHKESFTVEVLVGVDVVDAGHGLGGRQNDRAGLLLMVQMLLK